MPAAAEEIMVFRVIELAQVTGGRLHILHVSTAGSVDLIRRAKRRGVSVTGPATGASNTGGSERLFDGRNDSSSLT